MYIKMVKIFVKIFLLFKKYINVLFDNLIAFFIVKLKGILEIKFFKDIINFVYDQYVFIVRLLLRFYLPWQHIIPSRALVKQSFKIWIFLYPFLLYVDYKLFNGFFLHDRRVTYLLSILKDFSEVLPLILIDFLWLLSEKFPILGCFGPFILSLLNEIFKVSDDVMTEYDFSLRNLRIDASFFGFFKFLWDIFYILVTVMALVIILFLSFFVVYIDCLFVQIAIEIHKALFCFEYGLRDYTVFRFYSDAILDFIRKVKHFLIYFSKQGLIFGIMDLIDVATYHIFVGERAYRESVAGNTPERVFTIIYWRDFFIQITSGQGFIKNIMFLVSLIGMASSILAILLLLDPMDNLISLVLVFLYSALYFLIVQLDFLAFMLIILYVGAVVVLFLFCIMFLNLRGLKISYSPNGFREVARLNFLLFLKQGDLWVFIFLLLSFGAFLINGTNYIVSNYVEYSEQYSPSYNLVCNIWNTIVFATVSLEDFLGWESITTSDGVRSRSYLRIIALVIYIPALIILAFMFFIALLALMAVATDYIYMVFKYAKKDFEMLFEEEKKKFENARRPKKSSVDDMDTPLGGSKSGKEEINKKNKQT